MDEVRRLLAEVNGKLTRIDGKLDRVDERADRHRTVLRVLGACIAGLLLLGIVFGLNYRSGRIGDCRRTNDARNSVRLVVRLAGNSTERAVARFGDDGAEVLDALREENDATERTAARLFPPRDCGGFLP